MKETYIGLNEALKKANKKKFFTAKNKRYYYKNKNKGICVACVKRKAVKGFIQCKICTKKRNDIYRKNKNVRTIRR